MRVEGMCAGGCLDTRHCSCGNRYTFESSPTGVMMVVTLVPTSKREKQQRTTAIAMCWPHMHIRSLETWVKDQALLIFA